ncbi:11233_t:CDS:2, partial [Scutellospora calospora]
KRIDRYRELESYLEMVKGEELMMKTLNPKLFKEIEGFEMNDSKKFHEDMLKREKETKLDDVI